VVLGANELVMAPHAELGPLDVQMVMKDDLWEMRSGLTILESLEFLEQRAFQSLEDYFLRIKARSGNTITFRTATEVSSALIQGLLQPIYAQIDPMQVGQAARAISIARDYGRRLIQDGMQYQRPGADRGPDQQLLRSPVRDRPQGGAGVLRQRSGSYRSGIAASCRNGGGGASDHL
jgi:hypothetical protein